MHQPFNVSDKILYLSKMYCNFLMLDRRQQQIPVLAGRGYKRLNRSWIFKNLFKKKGKKKARPVPTT